MFERLHPPKCRVPQMNFRQRWVSLVVLELYAVDKLSDERRRQFRTGISGRCDLLGSSIDLDRFRQRCLSSAVIPNEFFEHLDDLVANVIGGEVCPYRLADLFGYAFAKVGRQRQEIERGEETRLEGVFQIVGGVGDVVREIHDLTFKS